MNRQSVINKFIEKCGPLDPKPEYGFAQGRTKYNFGLTTQLELVLSKLKGNNITVSPAPSILPTIHYELNGLTYTWDSNELLICMRMLQNKPFSLVSVFHYPNQPFPIAFHRAKCDVSILLAPYVHKKSEFIPEQPTNTFKGNPWTAEKPQIRWIKQMPNSTFWLVEFDTLKGSFVSECWGYPIGRMLKCYNCQTEIGIEEWPSMLKRNHPECMCMCNTYDDFCGCIRKRELAKYDRLWQQARKSHRWAMIQEKKWAEQ